MFSRSTLTLIVFVLAIATIVGYRYDQYVVQRDYLVDAAAPCDAAQQTCFVADCSSQEDAECDTTPYEKVELPGRLAPSCLLENSCEAFDCSTANDCSVTYCTPDGAEDGETCTQSETASSSVDTSAASSTDTTP